MGCVGLCWVQFLSCSNNGDYKVFSLIRRCCAKYLCLRDVGRSGLKKIIRFLIVRGDVSQFLRLWILSFAMSMWASRDKVFNDVSMFNLSWEAYFRWSRGQKSVHHLLWSPISILKLNFGGSFLKDVRDSMGHHLCSYFGLKLVSESNEAEVYVMLVGCRELKS